MSRPRQSGGDIIGGRRRIALGVLGAVFISVTSGAGSAATEEQPAGNANATDHVLLKLAPGVEVEGALGQQIEGSLGEWRRVDVPEGKSPEQTVEELQSTDGIETASLDPTIQLDPISIRYRWLCPRTTICALLMFPPAPLSPKTSGSWLPPGSPEAAIRRSTTGSVRKTR